MKGLHLIRRWKIKRRIKKLEEKIEEPISVTVGFSSWDFKGIDKALEIMAKEIADQISVWHRNIKDELKSLKQDLHR